MTDFSAITDGSDKEFIWEAIRKLCPNGCGYNGTDITTTSDPIPTQSEIDAQVVILKAEYAAQDYARNRVSEYPPIADQQDMQFHDAIDGTTTWQDAIQAVKDKYPKPE